jgi:glutaredoxin
MVLRHDCHFCAESVPFYKSLRGNRNTDTTSSKPQFIVLTADDHETAMKYIEANELSVDGVVTVPVNRLQELRVAGTPTLLLVDQTGLIQRVWLGKLDSNREAEVRAVVDASDY